MNKEELTKVLEEYPVKIEEAQIELFKLRKAQIERDIEKRQYETAITLQVEKEATLEENKKDLSNATKRSVEVKKRLEEFTDYQQILASYGAEATNIAVKDIKLERLQREFRAVESLVRLRD